ncbi:glucosamine-6-phosphate deaminase [Rummeliibacillus stabekisii]|uniref:glucosamine-6-phosphate deaminase n=1 Tax=Rummeliibacillus stabekisii TaxID=241244 RepID=UPI00116E4EF7|nr:glucosamine-6-phosphate deaminase [Rummeliibacillus stabekisii]MBB5169686.1 glucosamine-6-phosphate deaminase [Rummeliibacillus stabekisii]GEL03943.1 glucosamine-6-phosphate deaminase [Rummeliibacillus stabekisii]
MAIQLETVKDLDQLYTRAFQLIEEQKDNGAKTFGLATGGTMLPLYERIRNSSIDFSNCESVNLDEYVGLPKEHPEGYLSFMTQQLFKEKPFKNSHLPNGEATNPELEAKRYEELLQSLTLDFQLLGVGENGHIGFNEPGTSFDSETHVVDLTPSTRTANARFFESIDEVPEKAITMGIKSIMRAKYILLIAVGEKKRDAIKSLIDGNMTEEVPVTVLNNHPNVIVLTDLDF